ncbi:MAG: DUF4181 domain-containing protein [Lactovum sp.]
MLFILNLLALYIIGYFIIIKYFQIQSVSFFHKYKYINNSQKKLELFFKILFTIILLISSYLIFKNKSSSYFFISLLLSFFFIQSSLRVYYELTYAKKNKAYILYSFDSLFLLGLIIISIFMII